MKQITVTVNTPASTLLSERLEGVIRAAIRAKVGRDLEEHELSRLEDVSDVQETTTLALDGVPFFRFHALSMGLNEDSITIGHVYEVL